MGDLSVVAWLFPNMSSAVGSALVTVLTAFVGYATKLSPILWIFLALLAGLVALVMAHLWLWFEQRKARPKIIANLSSLHIDVGENGQFVSHKSNGLYKTKKTLKFELSNVDKSMTIFNCKVEITKIEPDFGYGSWILRENFMLAAGERIYIPIARYSEAYNPKKSDYHDDVIEICMPENTPYLKVPLLQTEVTNKLTIRATGINIPFCEVQCELSILDGRMHIKSNDVLP